MLNFEIQLKDFQFHPKKLIVPQNSTVKWIVGTNQSQSQIYLDNRFFVISLQKVINPEDSDEEPLVEESPPLYQQNQFQFQFELDGKYDIVCCNYSWMKGQIEVVKTVDFNEHKNQIKQKKPKRKLKRQTSSDSSHSLVSNISFDINSAEMVNANKNYGQVAIPPPLEDEDERAYFDELRTQCKMNSQSETIPIWYTNKLETLYEWSKVVENYLLIDYYYH